MQGKLEQAQASLHAAEKEAEVLRRKDRVSAMERQEQEAELVRVKNTLQETKETLIKVRA